MPDRIGAVIGWTSMVFFVVWFAWIIREAYLKRPYDWPDDS